MKVDYINHMGDDLTVVNAARVSFNKESEWNTVTRTEWEDNILFGALPYPVTTKELNEGDKKLIRYLAAHGHWTPFSHPQITVRVKAPIFVARQLFKHKVGFTENEVSRRYVDDAPEFFYPEAWRGRPTNGAKQGSSEDVVETIIFRGTVECWETEIDKAVSLHNESSFQLYASLLEGGVAPEQARMVLPQSMYTEWYWTASLAAFARMCRQRLDSHAQGETREIAQMISDIIQPLFPISWGVLIGNE